MYKNTKTRLSNEFMAVFLAVHQKDALKKVQLKQCSYIYNAYPDPLAVHVP